MNQIATQSNHTFFHNSDTIEPTNPTMKILCKIIGHKMIAEFFCSRCGIVKPIFHGKFIVKRPLCQCHVILKDDLLIACDGCGGVKKA